VVHVVEVAPSWLSQLMSDSELPSEDIPAQESEEPWIWASLGFVMGTAVTLLLWYLHSRNHHD
jgi:hypothetical protein